MRLNITLLLLSLGVGAGLSATPAGQSAADRARLLTPNDPAFTAPAAPVSRVRLETTKGPLVIEVIRAWAPLGADRFVNLVRHGYYDDTRLFRVRPGTWVQFGIAGDPTVAQAWRSATFPDDPAGQSNARGTVAFAFAVPNGRTTQVFINLRDNSASHDKEPFVPFGRVVEGMDVADAFNAEYGEGLGGIRAGKQDAGFAEGNAFFDRTYPRLDRIVTGKLESATGGVALAQVPVVKPGAPGKPSRELSKAEMTAAKAAKHSPADTRFMQGMIGHHAQAVEMVELLKTRTQSEQMRMLGLRIEVSQNDEIKMMRAWLEARGETVPDEHAHHMPGGMMPGMLTAAEMAELAAAKGVEFDRLFLDGMIRHHGGALVMVEELFDAPGAAQEAEIYDFASHVDSDQRSEILKMNTMLKGIKR